MIPILIMFFIGILYGYALADVIAHGFQTIAAWHASHYGVDGDPEPDPASTAWLADNAKRFIPNLITINEPIHHAFKWVTVDGKRIENIVEIDFDARKVTFRNPDQMTELFEVSGDIVAKFVFADGTSVIKTENSTSRYDARGNLRTKVGC